MGQKSSFFKGVSLIAASKYSNIIVGIVITAILSRILTPADFGLVAIATVLISFFYLLSDLGIAPAIIQYRDMEQEDISHLFGWTFWLGVFLSGLFFLSAPIIANFYNQPYLTLICQIMSLQILFATLNIVPNALLMREKKFGIVAVRNVAINICCGLLSVIAALTGVGIFSLLISPVLGGLLNLLVNEYYMKLPIKVLPRVAPIKKIFSFSLYAFLFNFFNYFCRNFDKLLIGKVLPAAELGYYEKSYRLMMLPIGNINGVIDPVLHPFLSELRNDKSQLLNIYNRMNKILVVIAFPIAAFCVVCGRELVLLFFGEQWHQAVPYFTFLAISVAFQISIVSTGAVLQSCYRTDLAFKLGVINSSLAISGLIIAAMVYGSVLAIVIFFDISAFLAAIVTFYTVYRFCFHSSPLPFFKYCIPTLLYFCIVLFIWRVSGIEGINNLFITFTLKIVGWSLFTFVFLQFFTQYRPLYYLTVLKNRLFK